MLDQVHNLLDSEDSDNAAMTTRDFAILNLLFVAALFLLTWLALGKPLVPGVTTRPLGPCAADWCENRQTLVLA
jgi:hypothetical protein